MCRYYQQYKRCKFGEFCAYAHINVVDPVIQELIELKARLSEIELQLMQKNCEILTLLERLNFSSDSANPPEETLTFQDLSPSPKKVNIGVNTDSGMDEVIPQLDGMEHALDSSYSPFSCEICEQGFLNPDDFIIHEDYKFK